MNLGNAIRNRRSWVVLILESHYLNLFIKMLLSRPVLLELGYLK